MAEGEVQETIAGTQKQSEDHKSDNAEVNLNFDESQLYYPSGIKKEELWQCIRYVAPSKEKKQWKNADRIAVYCIICKVTINYDAKKNANGVSRHCMKKKHQKLLNDYREKTSSSGKEYVKTARLSDQSLKNNEVKWIASKASPGVHEVAKDQSSICPPIVYDSRVSINVEEYNVDGEKVNKPAQGENCHDCNVDDNSKKRKASTIMCSSQKFKQSHTKKDVTDLKGDNLEIIQQKEPSELKVQNLLLEEERKANIARLKLESSLLQKKNDMLACENKMKLYDLFLERIKKGMSKRLMKKTFPGVFPETFYSSDSEVDQPNSKS